MPEEKISLQQCIDVTNKFIKGEITQKEFADFGTNMSVRSYIPIKEKIAAIITILTKYQYSDTSVQEFKIQELYIYLFFSALLGGYAGIDCSDFSLLNAENYDLLCPLFQPFVLAYCKDDYEILKEMLFNTINAYNIKEMVDALVLIDTEEIKKGVQANKDLIDSLDKSREEIKELNNIMVFNDPTTQKVVEELKRIGRERAIKNNEE